MKITIAPDNHTFLHKLQSWCAGHKTCAIAYRQNSGETIQVTSQIVDLFSWQGKDYLLMEKGQLICLDRLVSVSD